MSGALSGLPPSQPANHFLYGCGLVVLAGAVLSLGAFCVRLSGDMGPWAYIFWRSLAFATTLTIIAVVRAKRDPVRQIAELGPFGWMGALFMTAAATSFIASLAISTLAETFFICSLAPLIAALLAYPVLKERIGMWTMLAIGLALIGLYLIAGASFGGNGSWIGRGLALISGFAFAGYTLCTRGALAKDLDGMLIVFGLASAAVGLIGTLATAVPLVPSLRSVLLSVLHGGAVLSLGLLLLGQGSRYIGAVPMTMLVQTEAVLSPLWGFVFFAEHPSQSALIGGAIILTAVVVQALDSRGPATSQSDHSNQKVDRTNKGA